MELIFLLLRELRFLFKSKKIKIYITIGLILFLLSMIYGRVFATIDTGYNLPYRTYDGYTYNTIPDLPAELANYEYFCIVPFCHNNSTYNNKIVLLFSHNPIYYKDNNFYSVDLCPTGSYYCITDSQNDRWYTHTLKLYRSDVNNASFEGRDSRNPVVYFSNSDIYYKGRNEVYFSGTPSAVSPYILNSAEDLATGSFDSVLVESGNFDLTTGSLYLHLLTPTYSNTSIPSYYFSDTCIYLGNSSVYQKVYNYENNIMVSYFDVPKSSFSTDFQNGVSYYLILNDSSENLGRCL